MSLVDSTTSSVVAEVVDFVFRKMLRVHNRNISVSSQVPVYFWYRPFCVYDKQGTMQHQVRIVPSSISAKVTVHLSHTSATRSRKAKQETLSADSPNGEHPYRRKPQASNGKWTQHVSSYVSSRRRGRLLSRCASTWRTKRPFALVIIIHMISMRFHEHNSKDVHNNGTQRSSSNDLMRFRHPFVFLLVDLLVSPPDTMSHCMSHCTCSSVS